MSELHTKLRELRHTTKSKIDRVRSDYREERERLILEALRTKDPAKAAKKSALFTKRSETRKHEESLPKRYTVGEEIANAITHGIGAGISIAALVLLILRALHTAPRDGFGFYVTGFTIFGVTLVILYLMSTLYHALTPSHVKKIFAVFDHSSIYLLIAGTYTPFCLTTLRGTTGWAIFGIIWGLALAGITFYAIFGSRMRRLSVITYILMGWLIVIASKTMYLRLPHISLLFLVIGGLAYTVGVIFYSLKKIKWMHSVWHLFVLAGSLLHFFAVFFSIP
jgi:hemolysin III